MRLKVREISSKGESVLVEYIQDRLTVRKVLAHRDIQDGEVDSEVLDQAAPYGVPVAELMSNWSIADLPTRLEIACRDRGLWTEKDFTGHPALVMAALQQALALDANYLISLAITNGD